MRQFLAVGLVFVLSASAHADSGDDTLRFFLSRSDLVVVVTITSDPQAIPKEAGAVHYNCNAAVAEVLKGAGEASPKDELSVSIIRLEREAEDKVPYLKKGGKCILFLKSAGVKVPYWESADVWFGVQRHSPWMARSLKRLAQEKTP
jgi:hypothetical protein